MTSYCKDLEARLKELVELLGNAEEQNAKLTEENRNMN
jgi:hypothetical protein